MMAGRLRALQAGTVHRLRKPGRPEACQWDIYRKLGITTMEGLPKSHVTVPATKRIKTKKHVVTQKS
jgi:hypothetical protein